MIMKKILLFFGFAIFTAVSGFSQCTDNGTLKNSKANETFLFNDLINCPSGTVTFNDAGGQGTLVFDRNVTIDSLVINFQNGEKPINIFIPDTVTVTVNGGILFGGQPDKDKFLTVEGTLDIGTTLDFGSIQFEIDGVGTISANRIQGGGDTTCSTGSGGTGTCPTISASECTDGGICNDGNFTLPIELKSFTASKSNKNINLDWVTAKEENFSHFEIERSLDQKNWEQIGMVQGMGESMSDVYYDFTDRSAPFGVIYYRLKSVDIDASFEHSHVVKIEIGFEGKLAVSPNPVKDASNLKIQVPIEFREDLAYVGLFDLNGTKVQEFRNFNTDGSLQIAQKLKSGMYILKVNHNGLQENIRIIIQ